MTAGMQPGNGTWIAAKLQAAQNGYGDGMGITAIAGNGEKHTHTFTGTAKDVSIIPPYTAVYMWKRVS